MVTPERFRELVSYDPATGDFRWLVTKGSRHAGDAAGTVNGSGYLQIKVDGRIYKAHRLAWLDTHGRWPLAEIDHVNGVRADNRLANLREATIAENRRNSAPRVSKSGFRGIRFRRDARKWEARIQCDGVCHSLGFFLTLGEARDAYSAAARRLHGEFMRQG